MKINMNERFLAWRYGLYISQDVEVIKLFEAYERILFVASSDTILLFTDLFELELNRLNDEGKL